MFEERLATIRKKLEELNQLWPDSKETLCPGATSDQIRAFENEYGVTLPADYQAFIESIGDGIYNRADLQFFYLDSLFGKNHPVSLHPKSFGVEPDTEIPLCFGLVPFPIRSKIVGQDEDGLRFGLPSWTELSFDERMESSLALIINSFPDWTLRVLVLTGEEKGFVWHFDENTGLSKPYQNEETSEHLSFLDWFEARLGYDLYRSGSSEL